MIAYSTVRNTIDLHDILALQLTNLPSNISENELRREGFVTIRHDIDLLSEMNRPYPHILAKETDRLIGYALVMERKFKHRIPILIPMFDQIDRLVFNNKNLKDGGYFVMGQICIEKEFRGQGVFAGLYAHMKTEMAPHFECVITEVSSRNPRSYRAHEKIGFQTIHTYESQGETWYLLAWDWK